MSIVKNYPLNYSLDDRIDTKNNTTVYTSEGYIFSISDALKDPVDVSVNNYSNQILTKKDTLGNLFEDKLREKQIQISTIKQYTTYLAPVLGHVVYPVRYVSVVTDSKSESQVSCEGYEATVEQSSSDDLRNRNFFELEFLPEYQNLLRIKHYDTHKTIYLTYAHGSGQLFFDSKGAPSLGSGHGDRCFAFAEYSNPREDPQIFEYMLDPENGYIKLFKYGLDFNPASIFDVEYKLYTIGATGTALTLIEEEFNLQEDKFWESTRLFKIQLPEKVPISNITSPFTVYNDADLSINKSETVDDVSHNLLLHNEFLSNKSGVNSITLKNQLPNTFEQTSNNLIPGSNKVNYRDYTSISSGGNQSTGNDRASLIYSEYTTEIDLPSDNITYFHLPVEIYPFTKLHISDSGLIESGARPGDKPINSDKIFKKQADYEQSMPHGDPSDDHSGKWLCAWLYSPTGKSSDAIWVDRYYDSNTYTHTKALNTAVDIDYDNLIKQKEALNDKSYKKSIFDVQSSLMFEPNVYYAYHHIGNKDVEKYIKSSTSEFNIVDEFRALNLSKEHTYPFPSTINEQKGVNISFTLKKDPAISWATPLGYHILGNYTNRGISVYNRLDITPLIYMISSDKAHVNVYNNNLDLLATIGGDAPDPTDITKILTTTCVGFTVLEPFGNIFCLRQDSSGNYYLYEYNHENSIIEFTKLSDLKGTYTDMVAVDNIIHTHIGGKIHNISTVTETVSSGIHPNQIDNIHDKRSSLAVVGTPFINTVDSVKGNSHTILSVVHEKQGYVMLFKLNTDEKDTSYIIKAFEYDQDGNIFIIFKDDDEDDQPKDYIISFDSGMNYRFLFTVDILTDVYTLPLSEYAIQCITELNNGALEKYSRIIRYVDGDVYSYKLTQCGKLLSIDKHSDFTGDIKTCQNFNRQFKKFGEYNKLYLKHKIYNIIDKDDYKTISHEIDIESLFSKSEHHISYNYNPLMGVAVIYIDGEEVSREVLDTDTTDTGKYTFSNITASDFKVGGVPYLNSGSISEFLKIPSPFIGSSKYDVINFKMHSASLDYYTNKLIHTLYGNIDDIKWPVPYTRRHFIDNIDKVQLHTIPGIKSNNIKVQLHTNDDLDTGLQEDISSAVNNKIREYIPGNVNLNTVDWI
jgi:hypothetical protein